MIQDVEVPVERLAEFVTWFDEHVGHAAGLAVPAAQHPATPGRRTRCVPAPTYVNVGFWGTVPIEPGARDGDRNRAVEAKVTELGGHKSLYSDAYYDRATFDALYDQDFARTVRKQTDPDGRLTELYDKAVQRR